MARQLYASQKNAPGASRVRSNDVRLVGLVAACSSASRRAAPARARRAKGWPHARGRPDDDRRPRGDLHVRRRPEPEPPRRSCSTRSPQHHIHAVFFLVGEMDERPRRSPAIIERILREGHIIANHTMHAQGPVPRQGAERAAVEIDDGKARDRAGRRRCTIAWFRAPYGVALRPRSTRCSPSAASRTSTGTSIRRSGSTATPTETVDYVTEQLSRADGPQRAAHARHQEGDGRRRCREILDWIDAENARARRVAAAADPDPPGAGARGRAAAAGARRLARRGDAPAVRDAAEADRRACCP